MNILKEAIHKLNEDETKYFLGLDSFAKHLVDDYKAIPRPSGDYDFSFSKTLLDTFIHPSPLLSLDKEDSGYGMYSYAKYRDDICIHTLIYLSSPGVNVEPLINHILSNQAQEKLKQFLKMDYIDFNFKKALDEIGNFNSQSEFVKIWVIEPRDILKRYFRFVLYSGKWEVRITFKYNPLTDKFESLSQFKFFEIGNSYLPGNYLTKHGEYGCWMTTTEFDVQMNNLKEILELRSSEVNSIFNQYNNFLVNLNLNSIGNDWIKLTKADLFGKLKEFKVQQAQVIPEATINQACNYVLDKIPAELNEDDLNALFTSLKDFCKDNEVYWTEQFIHVYLYKVLEIDVAENTNLLYDIKKAVTAPGYDEDILKTYYWIPAYYINKELLSKINILAVDWAKIHVFIEEGLTSSDLSNFNITWAPSVNVTPGGCGVILHIPSSITGHLDLFKLIDLDSSLANLSIEIRITPVKNESGEWVSPFEIPKAQYEELKKLKETNLPRLAITFAKN